ncbi:S66 peptidase family protein [Terracidiphilus gabretensis]|jgi:muramoyltetrapeptide carboxypeptidase|uniref:S66 peptidase family protein n=1 Tax=Terracidiphilus gabretensis TaxID=1577687 RepID=UPI00071B0C40|nr:LD-carboxypeptidase [Terracidiphilus gabretensis]
MDARVLLKPSPVASGAGIGIIAPASFARQERFTGGMERLRALGFVPQIAENALARGPLFFAGTPQQRIADLHSVFANPETQAVMCLRGGYGSNYLLDRIDLEVFRAHPKPFFAYSDLTGLQLHLLDELGIPAFHGPMLAADFYLEDGVHLPSFRASLAGEPYSVGAAEGLRALKPGSASGTLYGGCLSILVAMLGTPWEPQTEGKLLFIEDVGAKPYQIDRMLWQLRKAGKLDNVTGIVFGEMLDCTQPGADPDLLDKTIMSALDGFAGPIAIGLRSGHVSRQNVTLTFGVAADLHVSEESELKLLEPAVRL